ncbi:alpha/beta hydrolase [Micromonospora cathayae]|uniref:Alpha/beta hydrolase n=1 Tax=Micromonospora cathayae TaxID=3028804 RepID=A0ABY7ZLU9_9ACTN|nr:alpha/beta hydrolase [Micromonospora sp. HUAS 3]WDZ83935.1 alpha/beta hydrolase [Micromonospora sp. HUAS 3]
MSKRTSLAAAAVVVGAALIAPSSVTAAPAGDRGDGVRNVIPITQILAFGQKVTAVAVEYSAEVNPRTLSRDTYTVSDSLYNFRFNPVADLTDPSKRADRTVTAVYTNDTPDLNADRQSDPGRYVIVELDARDPGGNTIMATGNHVKVNPDLQTQVKQNEDVHAQPGRAGQGRGPRLAAASTEAYRPTRPAVNLLADDFVYQRFTTTSGTLLPYAYHLPAGYDAARRYPVVVVLPGHGMGFNGTNEGVQVAADIPATAWSQEKWTGTDEDVIVLAPQNQRVGTPAAQADAMVELLNAFTRDFSVDQDRIYASTVSYGSTLAWAALATHPRLFDAALITGGFGASAAQATAIAANGTPVWITHGTHDHLLNVVTTAQTSYNRIWNAHIALGKTPAQANAVIKYTEYADSAFSEPDYHLAAAPTYEDRTILRWLLAQ